MTPRKQLLGAAVKRKGGSHGQRETVRIRMKGRLEVYVLRIRIHFPSLVKIFVRKFDMHSKGDRQLEF